MQLNRIGIAEGANIRPVRDLPTDLCAIGSSGWTRNAGRSCRRMLLVPVIVLAAARGSTQSSALRVIKLYQGSVRYELRCGQLYARTIVVFADRRHTGRAESVVLGDTHAWRRGS